MSDLGICIYDRVTLGNGMTGEVHFMGVISGKEGMFYGIKLDGQQGKNNGTYANIKYFSCPDNYGIFVTAHKIQKSEATSLNESLPRVCIGDRVNVTTCAQEGTVKFVGIVDFEDGCWYGVELDEPLGENNGSVNDRNYFECMEYYGIFAQIQDIETQNKHKKRLTVGSKSPIKSSSDISDLRSYQKPEDQKVLANAPPPPTDASTNNSHQSKQNNLLNQDIDRMGFIQLKARCGMEGLSTFGTKKQLLTRLRQHLYPNEAPATDNNANTKPEPKQETPIQDENETTIQQLIDKPSLESEFDPELHDLDPSQDDFYQPIAKANTMQEVQDMDSIEAREIGSVIVHRKPQQIEPNHNHNAMEPLHENEEHNDGAIQNNNPHNPNVKAKPPLNRAQTAAQPQTNKNFAMPQPSLTQSKSTAIDQTQNANGTDPPPPNESAQDWIMLPDPNSGKMYYANLKTKETRWQPPPGFGVTEAIQNQAFNPGIRYQNAEANKRANQIRGGHPVWTSLGGNNPQFQGNNPQGYLGRQVSPFSSATNMQQQYGGQNPANTFQQNQQWAQSASQFQSMGAKSNMSLGQHQNQMPKAKSAMRMDSKTKSSHKKGKKSRQANDLKPSSNIDPMTKLEAAKWKKTKDPSTGREYWYHKDTKQTTWEPPPAVQRLEAEAAVSGISGMADIEKPVWDAASEGSDYSTSGSYYDDGESEEDDDEDSNYGQATQAQNAQGFPNVGGPQPQQFNGFNPQQQQAQGGWNQGPPNGFQANQAGPQGPFGAQQGGGYPQQFQAGNNNSTNANFGQFQGAQNTSNNQQQQQAQAQGGYSPYPPQRQIPKQDSARQMYLKPQGAQQTGEHRDEKQAEDNPWISAEEAKSRVIVRDTLKRYWQIGAEQSFKLDGWAKMHYQMSSHKKGLFGKKQQSIADILSYVDFNKLKCPLNKAAASEEKVKEQCMQTWKNINSYMGIRKSGKGSEGHVEKLVRFALKGDDRLRNEIYCQLAKQTTKNPKLSSLLKGWKLLLICCSFFPPSDQFVDYLACFIWNNTQQPNEIGQYAIKALHALDATMLSGSRKFPPLPLEIVKLENLQPIPLNIYFINSMKCKQVLVTSQTRAKQVLETLAQTFNFQYPEAFGLYEMEPNIPPLDKMKKKYIHRELMSQQEKINDLIKMPFERELEEDDRMLDVIASWLKRDQSKRRKGDNSKKKKKHHKSSKNVRFVLKVKTFRKPMEKGFSHMGAKANFLTHVWHVVNDFYPIGIEDEDFAFDLAALQLQGTYGPNPKLPPMSAQQNKQSTLNIQAAFYKQGLLNYDLHKYLGQNILKKYLPGDRNACEQKILQFRGTKYSNMQRHDCWLRYAKMLRSNKKMYNYFGCAWYRGVRIQGDAGGTSKKGGTHGITQSVKGSLVKTDRNTNDLLVGINEHAITFVNPITQNVVERYEMEEILTFGYRSNAFLFVAGTLMTQSKMQIATMHGKAMNRLVRTHIDLRVRDAEKKGQKLKNVPKGNDI